MATRTRKRAKKAATAVSAFRQEQNRIRGVISQANKFTHALPKGEHPTSQQLFLDGVRRVLLESRRSALTKAEQFKLVKWAESVRAEGVSASKSPLSYGLGKRIHRTKPQDFNQELAWLIARLDPVLDNLRAFRQSALALDRAFWKGDEEQVWTILSKIEEDYKESIWSLELRIAFAQFFGGLDAQKNELKSFKKKHPISLPTYLAHYFSARNEASSTIRRFREDAARRLDRTKLEAQLKQYLKYKLADEFSAVNSSLSTLLSSEQSQSTIDIYETAVDLLQRLVRSSASEAHREQITACLIAWRPINDFRLTKLSWALDVGCDHELPVRGTEALQALLNAEFGDAYSLSSQEHTADPSDILSGIESGVLSQLIAPKERQSTGGKLPWDMLGEPLWSVLLRSIKFEESLGLLDKFCRNFRGLVGAAAIGDFISFATAQGAAKRNSLGAINLNISSLSVWDLLNVGPNRRVSLSSTLAGANVSQALIDALGGKPSQEGDFALPGAAALLTSLGLSTNDPDGAYISLLDVNTRQTSDFMRGLIVSRRIELALHLGEFGTAISDIADEAARSPASRVILPVEDAISGRDWSDLSSKNAPLDLAVAIDVAWRRTNNDVYGTYLRFALEDFLQACGVDRPSKLTVSNPEDREKIIYLLEYIAVPEVMDLTGTFESSAEVIEERSDVCALLLKLNPDRGDAYREEIDDIAKGKMIQEGLRIIDYSRINVDTVAIARWAEQQYKESYSRYRALVDSGIGVSEDIDELLRKMASGNQTSGGEYFYTPDNEADALLLEMVLAIKDKFLSSEEYGLEFFLGKRIRHGTLVGHLRGPVENVALITQRESDAQPYRSNDEWLNRLQFDGVEKRDIVDRQFLDFSERFDEIPNRLKDEFLHVKSKQYPNGIFEFAVTQLAFQLIRSAIKTEKSFDVFMGSCFSLFWSLLEPSLAKARELLSPKTKDEASRLLDHLQNVVRENAVHDDGYAQFVAAARQANVEVQRQFDSMLEWFIKREVEQARHRFSLSEVVDISISSAMKSNRGYEPAFDIKVQELVYAPVSFLVAVSDMLAIIITNACVRAKSGHFPAISIDCKMAANDDALILEVINSLGPEYDREAAEFALGEIRRAIECGAIHQGANADIKSGLLKIAGLTCPHGGTVDFQIIDDGHFKTVVVLKVVTKEGSLALLPLQE